MPFSVRCYTFGLLAMALTTIAMLPMSRTSPLLLLAMCLLVVATERLSRVKVAVSGWTMSVSLVVTVITVLVLAPPAAALVGLVTSLTSPRGASWAWVKEFVNGAMLSLVPASGAAVCYLTGGHDAGHFLNFPSFLWPFAAAVTTCLVTNGLIAAGFLTLFDQARFGDVLRGTLQRAAMPYYSSAVLALIFLALWNDIGWYTAPLMVVPMYIAHWSLSQYAREEAAHEGTIAALVQAVEIKDSYTRGHSERVARGAEMLARQLKMPQERVAMLRFAGLLHDIGKLGVPTRLLTSTGGLTEEEFKLLCMHPNHGVAVLRDIRFLTEVYEGVLYHHERLDGRGYPTGKSGDEIPEFARIIGVADAFDAMTSTRSYRAARSVEEAVTELRRGAGTQFDPLLVRAFEKALALAEQAGRPWVPTELPTAAPAGADPGAIAPAGPWPLPKRVPGFSFADHDDPFVPAEWFSDWFPSWLADAWEGHPGGAGPRGPFDWPQDEEQPPAAPGGAIPGQRSAELLPGVAFDDGWSARMHSAVVRDSGESGRDDRWRREPGRSEEDGSGAVAHREPSGAAEGSDDPEPPEEAEETDETGEQAEPSAEGSMRLRDVSRGATAERAEDAPGISGSAAGSGWFSRDGEPFAASEAEEDRQPLEGDFDDFEDSADSDDSADSSDSGEGSAA